MWHRMKIVRASLVFLVTPWCPPLPSGVRSDMLEQRVEEGLGCLQCPRNEKSICLSTRKKKRRRKKASLARRFTRAPSSEPVHSFGESRRRLGQTKKQHPSKTKARQRQRWAEADVAKQWHSAPLHANGFTHTCSSSMSSGHTCSRLCSRCTLGSSLLAFLCARRAGREEA